MFNPSQRCSCACVCVLQCEPTEREPTAHCTCVSAQREVLWKQPKLPLKQNSASCDMNQTVHASKLRALLTCSFFA